MIHSRNKENVASEKPGIHTVCLKKPDRYDSYDIILPIHNVH